MRILLVHNYYQFKGGEDGVVESETDLLRRHGHVVSLYEAHNQNIETRWDSARTAVRCLWSSGARRTFAEQVDRFKPDLVHIHNFFPLISPAVHHVAHRRNLPVVQTLHNYRLLCPGATLLRNGRVCEICEGRWFPISAIRHGCYRNSRAATAAVGSMLLMHRVLRTWTKTVNRFVALSDFARTKFAAGGIPLDRICVKSNFLVDDPGMRVGGEEFILFAGRLSQEKGIQCLLDAWSEVKPSVTLMIAGDGPLAPHVQAAAQTDSSIRWLGFLPHRDVLDLMGRAMLLAFPSMWFEGFPLVLVEAFARGVPVVASNHGSMAEIVTHRETGILFTPGSSSELAQSLRWALQHRSEMRRMQMNARREFETKYTAEANYRILMNIYSEASAIV